MYLLLSAPALYCFVIAECLKRYLLAQAKPQSQLCLSDASCLLLGCNIRCH